jgi:hypothetical protein
MNLLLVVTLLAAVDIPLDRIAQDAKVVDRVAEVSKKDLPEGLLKRLVNEDIELLRGKHADGSYEYATHERLEAGRVANDFSVQPRKDDAELEKLEIRGSFVYRLIVSSPSRRMLVTKNRKVYIDRADVEFIPSGSTPTRVHSVKIEKWIAPGEVIPIDLPAVARQATARVYARADKETGYGNVVLTLVEAKVVDNADSPYADAVASARAIVRAIDNGEIPSIRAMASRMYEGLAPKIAAPARSTVDVVTTRPEPAPPTAVTSAPTVNTPPDVYAELQAIEDLLTGSETERRQGTDRLHQLIRRLRPR